MDDNSQSTKACPFCGEQVLAVAIKCKHCGERLDAAGDSEPKARLALTGRAKSIILGAVGLVVVVGGVIAFVATRPPPLDLSTPKKAANLFVDALNDGDEPTVLRIVGEDAVPTAIAECKKAKRKQDCETIGKDFGSFIRWVGGIRNHVRLLGPARLIVGSGPHETKSTLEDGTPLTLFTDTKEEVTAFDLEAPATSDQRSPDLLFLVHVKGKGWVPRYGAGRIPIANAEKALPFTATGWLQ